MSRPLLYKLDASPPACAVRMLADIIGLELDLKDVNLIGMEHKSADFLKINPMGTIPTLQDGDFIISESHTIMKYLLSKYGGAKHQALYPSDLRTRALVDQAMYFDTGVFFIRVKLVALPAIFEGLKEPSAKVLTEIDDCYGVIEAYLGDKKYVAADHLTLADISLGATTKSLQGTRKLDSEKFPRTFAWLSRLEQESFFKKIMIPGAEKLDHVLNLFWEKNKAQ